MRLPNEWEDVKSGRQTDGHTAFSTGEADETNTTLDKTTQHKIRQHNMIQDKTKQHRK